MPNWCSNVVEIHHDDKEKIDAIEKEYNRVEKDPKIFNVIRPIPPEHATGEGWYWWCIENWGTKWEPGIHTFERINDNTLHGHRMGSTCCTLQLHDRTRIHD